MSGASGCRSFVVRPKVHSRCYFEVHVFPGEGMMREYQRGTIDDVRGRYRALTIVHYTEPWLLGEILFTARDLTPELVAHEAAHAAEHYARRIGRRDGETIAAASGRIASEILRRVDHA